MCVPLFYKTKYKMKRKKRVNVRLEAEQIEQLKQVSNKAGICLSGAVRVILNDYLKCYNYSKTQ